MTGRIYVGCATWAIGARNDHLLPPARGNLERYALRLTAAEVNSSFHRSHRSSTWTRWARSVGPSFRFSVKVPRSISHEGRLRREQELVVEALVADELANEREAVRVQAGRRKADHDVTGRSREVRP